MRVRGYRDGRESIASAWDKNGNRLGFVGREPDPSDPAKTRYGIGIDNVGDPYRGVLDRELNTPLGNLNYGYDGDTVAAWLTPNVYGGSSRTPLPYGGDMASAWAGLGDYQLRANRFSPEGENPTYAAGLNFPANTNIPDYNRTVNTPLGALNVATNDGNPNIGASFQPNDATSYYIKALANLLRR